MKNVTTAILFGKIFYVVVFFLNISVLTSSCQKNPTKIEKYEWKSLGFEDKFALRLRLYEPYLYVCAGSNGLWRRNISSESSEWEYLGLADTSLGNYFNRGVMDVVVKLNDRTDILAAFHPDKGEDPRNIYKTTDGGNTWALADSGLYYEVYGYGYLEPDHPNLFLDLQLESQKIFAFSNILYESVDFGETWQRVDSYGTSYGETWTYETIFHFKKSNQIWVGGETGRFQEDLRKSTDGGQTWQRINLAQIVPHDNAVYSIAFDAENPDIVYVGMQGAVIKTTDGGKTWISPLVTNRQGAWFRGVVSDLKKSGHLFIAGGRDIAETWDGGETWTEIESPNETQVLDLIYDSDAKTLYIGSETGVFVYRP